jgi:hypothetical protein
MTSATVKIFPSDSDLALAGATAIDHRERCFALAKTVGVRQLGLDDEPVSVLHSPLGRISAAC